MSKPHSFATIYRVQRFALMLFFSLTAIALSIPLVRLVLQLSPDHLFPLAAALILYMALAVVAGTYVYYISYVPFHLATAFDPIKNSIAAGEIRSIEDLGPEITRFVTRFFNFTFLDISHAFLQLPHTGLISHTDLSGLTGTMDEFGMLDKSRQMEEIMRAGRITTEEGDMHLYILPVWFGEQWLGYMGLLSKRRIGRFFRGYLSELENNFLDDQIMLVLQMSGEQQERKR